MNPHNHFLEKTYYDHSGNHNGISIRDYIAIEMAKALISNQVSRMHSKTVISQAYEYADCLIIESNKRHRNAK